MSFAPDLMRGKGLKAPIRTEGFADVESGVVARLLADGSRVIVQFGDESTYATGDFTQLNALARQYGTLLEVRFYGHCSTEFNASVLRNLPDVKSLSLDGFWWVTGLENLFCMEGIESLKVGIFELSLPDLLDRLACRQLRELSVGGTRNSEIDLACLPEFANLETFSTVGQVKNLQKLTGLKRLKKLWLGSIPHKVGLGFLSELGALVDMTLFLGSRESIEEIAPPALCRIEIVRVRGLRNLGNLARFKALETLCIEDQAQITAIDVGGNLGLRNLRLNNCKALGRIEGVPSLPQLESMWISRSQCEYDEFVSAGLPVNLRNMTFFTGRKSVDAKIAEDIRQRGLQEAAWIL